MRICRESPCQERNDAYDHQPKRQRSCTKKPRRAVLDGACSLQVRAGGYASVFGVVTGAVVRRLRTFGED